METQPPPPGGLCAAARAPDRLYVWSEGQKAVIAITECLLGHLLGEIRVLLVQQDTVLLSQWVLFTCPAPGVSLHAVIHPAAIFTPTIAEWWHSPIPARRAHVSLAKPQLPSAPRPTTNLSSSQLPTPTEPTLGASERCALSTHPIGP